MKSFALLAPLALLSSSVLVAALPSHPGRRHLEPRNRALGEAILTNDGVYADLSGVPDKMKRDVLRLEEDGGALVRRAAKKTTSEWRDRLKIARIWGLTSR